MMQSQWYHINNVESLDTPVLVVHKERVKTNIDTAIAMVSDTSRLRPHVKTNKSPGAVKMMLEAGIQKFKCATIAEAEMLGELKAPDVLIAYQLQGPKIDRYIKLLEKFPGTSFASLVDNRNTAAALSISLKKNGRRARVFLDANVGMNRTGILPNEEAIRLYSHIYHDERFIVEGIHAYDGHMRNPDLKQRTQECDEAFASVIVLKERIEAHGMKVPVIIAGGSPSFPIHAQRNNCECSPGTFIYWDQGYLELCPEQNFLPAAVLVTRVVSCPSAGIICTDLGHKSVAAENIITRRVKFLNADDLEPISQSEEHLVLRAREDHNYKPGDILYALPYHICPTVALYERVFIIENGSIVGEWMNVARDRMLSV